VGRLDVGLHSDGTYPSAVLTSRFSAFLKVGLNSVAIGSRDHPLAFVVIDFEFGSDEGIIEGR